MHEEGDGPDQGGKPEGTEKRSSRRYVGRATTETETGLWIKERANSPVLRLEFDTLEEAQAELKRQQEAGHFSFGLLLYWQAVSGVSVLVASYS